MAKAVLFETRSVERAIRVVRGQRVLLDEDLAAMYQVEVKALNQAVRRNPARFPADFMFRLTPEEVGRLKVTICDLRRGGARQAPEVRARCVHGARRRHAVQRAAQPSRHSRQRRDHARLRAPAAAARAERRPRAQDRCAREPIRRSVSRRVRRHPRAHGGPREAQASHRIRTAGWRAPRPSRRSEASYPSPHGHSTGASAIAAVAMARASAASLGRAPHSGSHSTPWSTSKSSPVARPRHLRFERLVERTPTREASARRQTLREQRGQIRGEAKAESRFGLRALRRGEAGLHGVPARHHLLEHAGPLHHAP